MQWTNTGLDPQISKFSGQELTGTDEELGIARNAPKIKSRESSGKVPGRRKEKKKNEKKIILFLPDSIWTSLARFIGAYSRC